MTNCVCKGGTSFYDDDREMKKNSHRIDKELKKSAKEYQSTVKLLLLGPGESGKSTIVKQMRIIHTSQFSDSERSECINTIKTNIRDIICSIVLAMEHYNIQLENLNNKLSYDYILENAKCYKNVDNTEKFWGKFLNYADLLWGDMGCKRCAMLYGNEYNLLDSAQYFLDRIDVIRQKNYLPSDQDILRCRVLTTGILETKFEVKHIKFHLFDVGGQRDERRKWIQCFNEVTAVIFIADISAYNMTLREDPTVNRLQESLDLFRSIWFNRWLSRVSIILFLNKYDILCDKIQSNRFKLETYFPDYEEFEMPEHVSKAYRVENENESVTRAKMFILKKFMDITCENIDFQLNRFQSVDAIHSTTTTTTTIKHDSNNNSFDQSIPDVGATPLPTSARYRGRRSYELNNIYTTKTNLRKFCIPYFTCAVDTENIKRVFKGCYDILQREHLEKCGLIT